MSEDGPRPGQTNSLCVACVLSAHVFFGYLFSLCAHLKHPERFHNGRPQQLRRNPLHDVKVPAALLEDSENLLVCAEDRKTDDMNAIEEDFCCTNNALCASDWGFWPTLSNIVD